MSTTAPARRTRAAAAHVCVDCLALPGLHDQPPGYVGPVRPVTPRPTTGGPRSQRCATHKRAHERATKARARVARKVGKFRLPAELLLALWVAQGCACPCGNKRSPGEIPAGVTLDHNHDLAVAEQHDHPADEGCAGCVTGYLCPGCNRDVVGRLTRHRRGRDGVAAALRAIADHLDDPPLRRLLAQRPDLLAPTTPTGVAA